MKAEIMAIGTEILLGDIVNTNAQFLAKELASLGISLYHQSVVGDNENRILEAFSKAFENCDTIITTGGLGPTKDDLSKELAAKYFDMEMVLREDILLDLEDYFKRNNLNMTDNNKKQCYFPKEAIILKNPRGTAPGAIFEGPNNKRIILLPGPPREMEPMFKNYVVPYLRKFSDGVLVSKVLRILGLGESEMESLVSDLLDSENPTVAPYAKNIDVILRITAKGKNEKEAEKLIYPMEEEIRKRLGDNIYGEGDVTLEEVVGEMLVEKNMTISTAESCTGGLVAGTLINYGGISKVFMEGAVTYSNEAKMKRLGVKKETLDKFGAVSHECAEEMAFGIAKNANTRIGISTTGIAGPLGGTEDKPVGLVYVGLCIDGVTKVKKFNFKADRQGVRKRTVIKALDWLRRELYSLK